MPRRPGDSPEAFAYEQSILAAACANDGAVIECETEAKATYLVHRLNRTRVMLRRQSYAAHRARGAAYREGTMQRIEWQEEVDNQWAQTTPSDKFVIRRDGTAVAIVPRPRPFITIRRLDGSLVNVQEPITRILSSEHYHPNGENKTPEHPAFQLSDKDRAHIEAMTRAFAPKQEYDPNAPASDAPLDLETNKET